jgi:hypothetical protein
MLQTKPALQDACRRPASPVNGLPGPTETLLMGSPGKRVEAKSSAVIISTRGRPEIVNALVRHLGEQSRPPAHIFVIARQQKSPDQCRAFVPAAALCRSQGPLARAYGCWAISYAAELPPSVPWSSDDGRTPMPALENG